MAILNYTTTVEAYKTVSEIEHILVQHKAKSILKNYEGEELKSLSFIINNGELDIPVQLPVKIDECLAVLKAEKKAGTKNIKDTREQAERVAWRILKDWLLAQVALLDINMVKLTEIFMPYIVGIDGKTLYKKLEENNFALLDKQGK